MKKSESVKIDLPKDAGTHPLSNIEWWYSFGFLNGEQGSKYAIMASFFRFGEVPCFKGHYLIFSLIDLESNAHHPFSFIDNRGLAYMLLYLPYDLLLNPGDKRICKLLLDLLKFKIPYPHRHLSRVSEHKNPLQLIYDENSLSFISQSSHKFNIQLMGDEICIDIKFSPQKPIVLVGNTGRPDELYYYTFTRNHLQGHIKNRGNTENVRGEGWFDHQWGRDYDSTFKSGWDWFGIQLTDGRELLLNQFFNIKTKERYGPMANLVEKDGSLNFTRNVQYYPVKCWQSPITRALYPMDWIIIIPEFYMQLYVSPYFYSQEMPIMGHLQAIWEGACKVSGEEKPPGHRAKELMGKGFMELVGYANHPHINLKN